MNFAALPERLAHVRAEVARRQAAAGRSHPVTIVAVTKGFGPEAVEAALAAGLVDLGENRVQEALSKLDTPAGARATWHLIGHLQRNKAKHVPGRFALVHSLDSDELAGELDRRAAGGGARQRVLLQVNVAGEAQKSGCAPADARRIDDDRAVHGRRGRAAAHLSRVARAARRAAGGGPMAADALDGDVRRLRNSGRGGSNGDPVGYRPVRTEGEGSGGDVSGAAFHLTPLDVRRQEFRRSLRGYDTLGVDDFRVRVADELERILREKSVLEERVAALGEQLRAYRERERAMNEALVAAQQLREQTRAAAEREAQVIVREAEAEGRRVVEQARVAQGEVQRQSAEVQRQFQAYMAGFRALLERQLAELRALDGQQG